MAMRDIRGILFDKDGTLFDFQATWGVWTRGLLEAESAGDAQLMRRLADVLGYDLERLRFLPDSLVIASTADQVADVLLPLLPGEDKNALIARMNRLAAKAPQVEAAPLVPCLLGLAARDLSLGVATNDAEAPARAHLREAGVEHVFDFIAGYDSGYGAKPEPGQLLAFANAAGIVPEHCVMVGDSSHDMQAARAAGFVAIGVLTGPANRETLAPFADVVLDSIADIEDWLDAGS